jgi:hypothetical protein
VEFAGREVLTDAESESCKLEAIAGEPDSVPVPPCHSHDRHPKRIRTRLGELVHEPAPDADPETRRDTVWYARPEDQLQRQRHAAGILHAVAAAMALTYPTEWLMQVKHSQRAWW